MCSLKVSALLVSYNPDIYRLSEVLNSIHSQVDHLVLVDNGSKNKNDILALIADYEGVYTLLNDNNIGLASAQNVGIDYIIDNNLSDFIFSIIKALGVIILGWGIVQVGMSIQSHDASQRTQGFLCLFGGLMIAFAKEILTAIGAI